MLDRGIRFCLENKLVMILITIFVIVWGTLSAPFDWKVMETLRDPVPVDAIPDIGENQQIVFTRWMGRSPQDVEDQITYPLTTALLGMPGVKTIRSNSFFGFSSITLVFNEDIEFYWSRSRILEKLNSLPQGTLPQGVQPTLGPDATALGQVFWYTLEGRDTKGNPTGGWDLHELRSIQDWYVRYALQSVPGVSEVASIGGHVQEYQIDVDPDAMRAYGVTIHEIFNAVKNSNLDVGARTIEVNQVEYVIRSLGFIESLEDIENTVIKVNDHVPVIIKNVGTVQKGPALRRGALDKGGVEAVGGVVVVRYGANPLEVIKRVKAKIEAIAPGFAKKTLRDGTLSQVQIVPFYDRSELIYETLGTLKTALTDEILITLIVVLMMVMHLRSALLISALLPLSVLLCFIAMKKFGVDANIVALSGIAIAIGTMVDMGIVFCENILKHLDRAGEGENRLEVIFRATREVASAVLTAVLTTVVSFLPVFTMTAAEGKLFKPLAFTKSFALIASIIVAMTLIPPFAHFLFTYSLRLSRNLKRVLVPFTAVCVVGIFFINIWVGFISLCVFVYLQMQKRAVESWQRRLQVLVNIFIALAVGLLLASHWAPLGPERELANIVFVVLLIGTLLGGLILFQKYYEKMLFWCLTHKGQFLMLPVSLVGWGLVIWLGWNSVFAFAPGWLEQTSAWQKISSGFPGLGKEFMPPLDEGSYLFMPTTMPHASIGEALDVLQHQDKAIRAIPEVKEVVGKIGRVDSPLDPAPVSMIETVITYVSEYKTDKEGHRIRFRYNESKDTFIRDTHGDLIPDERGSPYRQWRPEIKKPDDIWQEITRVTKIPGTTSAPRLQPIAARIVMLQSGMRAPLGIKIYGPDQKGIEKVGLAIEKFLKQVPSVNSDTVVADRIVGKPYIEMDIDRLAIARYGVTIKDIQMVIEVAIGGVAITSTVEGRERYAVRVRTMREYRDQIEHLGKILVPARDGSQIPLEQLTTIRYTPGPQMIKSEDTFLVGYVVFDKNAGFSEVDVVEDCKLYLQGKMESGELDLPIGYNYRFAGSYENQVRSEKKLMRVLPMALFVIFLILYFQFHSVATTLQVFSGVFVAWAGGFIILWCYGQDWFLNFNFLGAHMRELFQVQPFNLSVAVWIGFLALFGIATDNGVILATYLDQNFKEKKPGTRNAVRKAVIQASLRRIRPCLMTAGTTILALIPILTSTGRGSDIMVPMAIPSFGGMLFVMISVFVVPVLYCWTEEWKLKKKYATETQRT